MARSLLILASASPRRHELLRTIVSDFDIHACPFSEPRTKSDLVDPRRWAEALAYFKARAVADRFPGRWVLGADTIVVCAGRLLGKPQDADDARAMLQLQAGRYSDVITGICLARSDGARRFLSDVTRVWMRNDPDQIETYIASGEWEGKAGAYGIQDVGDRLVERIAGSFSNVVGLPVERLSPLLTSTLAMN